MRALDSVQGQAGLVPGGDREFRLCAHHVCGLVDHAGNLQLYDGDLCVRDADGEIVEAGIPAEEYADYIGEATLPESYLKAPYYKPLGYPAGHLPRRTAGTHQCRRMLAARPWRTRNCRNSASASDACRIARFFITMRG